MHQRIPRYSSNNLLPKRQSPQLTTHLPARSGPTRLSFIFQNETQDEGEQFEDVEEIQRNVIRALKAILEEEFSRSFQWLYEHSKISIRKRKGLC